MRLDIRYTMAFRYERAVRESHNEVRVRPRDLPHQRLLAHRLTTSPPTRILSFTDYWGTTVDHLGYVFEHDSFDIVAEAAVETRERPQVGSAPLDALRDQQFSADNLEYLQRSPHTRWTDDIAEAGRDAVASASDVAAGAHAVVDQVRSTLRYERDTTYIGVPLADLVEGGVGVCQDFAHLSIAMLRAAGVPARYVSGYLFASDETSGDDDETAVEVQTHAWIEAAIPGQGWLPVDPTNDRPVGLRHVAIGHGRDYDDVPPVRGVYVGEGTPEVEASVEIRRMEPVERTRTDRPQHRTPRLIVPRRPSPAVSLDAAQQQQQQ